MGETTPNHHTFFANSYFPFQEQDLFITGGRLTKNTHQGACEIIQVVSGHIPSYLADDFRVGKLINVLYGQPVIDCQT